MLFARLAGFPPLAKSIAEGALLPELEAVFPEVLLSVLFLEVS